MPKPGHIPSREPALKGRAPREAAGLVLAALAAVALYIGGRGLSELAKGLIDHRPVIASDPWAGAATVLGLVSLGLAAVLIFVRPGGTARRRSRRPGGGRRTAVAGWRRYLAVALVGVVASLFAPAAQRAAVESVVAPHGYAPCPPIPSARRQPDRWARPVDICPVRAETPTS